MILQGLELRRVQLPLIAPFQTSFGTQTVRDIVLVRAITDAGEGWGECVTMPWPLYSSESTDLVIPLISAHLAPRLFAAPQLRAEDVRPLLGPIHGHPMAKAALEAAILDAELTAEGRSFAAYLGVSRDRVPCGVSVGIFPSIPELLAAVEAYLDQGYQRIKLKIQPGWDIEPVRAVRQTFGADVPLQVDANAAYAPTDITPLQALDPFDLLLIEQPFPEEFLLANADLRTAITTPLCLDESATSTAVVADAIRADAVDIINIKPGRVGGFLEAVEMHDLCRARGVPVWCGGMVESGIGRAANTALAALDGFTLVGDNSAFDRFFATDIVTDPRVMVDGHLRVPTRPGMGFELDVDAVRAATVETVTVAA
ncbi:o-succinylbenzoate synthase [Euzebya tangerina]|uniref:o-succinylbenzoate synthase n=1 Tax=Euzebya tangerina TaxID=591198 RepID=UPI000E311B7B|nr:o-succinylbenzoate synthase [Euzebya tangerina]